MTQPTTAPAATPTGEPPVFDVCGPLPQGTTVLEASAGTGKTFTIAALATRYVAEGVCALSELMLVTFGRAATSELRDRVRERLVTAERGLRSPDASDPDDALLAHLAAVPDAEREVRRARLTAALAEFDAATIATTHGFCQQMLTALGVTGDLDPDAVLAPDVADLRDEVVDDLYLRRYATDPEPLLSVTEARTIARAAVGDHDADLRPDDAAPDSLAGHRVAFARAVREELRRRKRVRRVVDYDDLLTLLRDALTDPVTGAAAAERVRSRYRVVMVDEFQDTDAVQWTILRTAFHGHRTLVLIGDPKQAIYAFRGGDVVTYLAAAGDAHARATLGRNWRSDEPVLTGLAAVLGGAALGDPRITVLPVDAEHRGRRLEGGAPVRLRRVAREALGGQGSKALAIGEVRPLIYADVAAQIVHQLQTVRLRDGDGWRPLAPGDVAVLARRNVDASGVRAALAAAGVPAVESGVSSVFAAPAAGHWLTLLLALAQPGQSGRVAAAALGPFVGWDAARLAGADGAARDALTERLRTWAHVLGERGVAALLEAASADGLTERLLRTTTGERTLTDLRHIGQALHAAARQERLGVAALSEWLRHRVAEAAEDYEDERSRRLETDAAAVQLLTVHTSKGLEFPVVHVPFAFDQWLDTKPRPLRHHDDAGTRLLHVGGAEHPSYPAAAARAKEEDLGEDLRLAYVAVTRARSQVVLWWAPTRNAATGPLSRLLLGGHGPGDLPPATAKVGTDDAVGAAFDALAARSGGTVAHEVVRAAPQPVRWEPPAADRPPLDVGRFARGLDATWRRTSYSGLTAAAHEGHTPAAGVASEPETTGTTDEVDVVAPPAPVGTTASTTPTALVPEDGIAAVPPLAHLPGGTTFGTLVHEVLETVDTAAPDLAAELRGRCRAAITTHVAGLDPDDLAAGLLPVLRTPLGPLAGGATLADIAPRDRLAELEFELPLAGGDGSAAGGRAAGTTLAALGAAVGRHLADDDPFVGYADRLAGLGTERLRGYLTGSIDAVLRVRDAGGDPRYLVVDYKTNRLAAPGEELTVGHYRPAAMATAMSEAHYPLQQLLYSVALHRFLRWRQPGYDPDRHLGGGLYLFVRGMVGPATPVVDGSPCGVMAWRPPTALVLELSALLDGRTP